MLGVRMANGRGLAVGRYVVLPFSSGSSSSFGESMGWSMNKKLA